MPRKHTPFAVRLAAYLDHPDECWYLPNKPYSPRGYVQVVLPGGRHAQAHRAVYEEMVGQIPHGLHLDHLCRNPRCVNPHHMEPVTPKENQRRAVPYWPKRQRDACGKGHKFVRGSYRERRRSEFFIERVCLICQHERDAERYRNSEVGRNAHPKGATHCRHGHEYTPENTIWRKTGGRKCRTCKNAQDLASHHRRKKRAA